MKRQNDRLYGAIGLAKKAGALKSGDFATEKLLRGGKAKLVLMDASASDNTRRRYTGMCERQGVPLMELPALGGAIGDASRMLAAVVDDNFMRMIVRAAEDGDTDKDMRG